MDNFVTTLLPNDVFTFSFAGFKYRIYSPTYSRLSLSSDEVDGSFHINLLPIDLDFDFSILKNEHV